MRVTAGAPYRSTLLLLRPQPASSSQAEAWWFVAEGRSAGEVVEALSRAFDVELLLVETVTLVNSEADGDGHEPGAS